MLLDTVSMHCDFKMAAAWTVQYTDYKKRHGDRFAKLELSLGSNPTVEICYVFIIIHLLYYIILYYMYYNYITHYI